MGKQIGEKWTDAKCPKCEHEHQVEIMWKGRGIPRIYCQNCKLVMSRWAPTEDEHSIGLIGSRPQPKRMQ